MTCCRTYLPEIAPKARTRIIHRLGENGLLDKALIALRFCPHRVLAKTLAANMIMPSGAIIVSVDRFVTLNLSDGTSETYNATENVTILKRQYAIGEKIEDEDFDLPEPPVTDQSANKQETA